MDKFIELVNTPGGALLAFLIVIVIELILFFLSLVIIWRSS